MKLLVTNTRNAQAYAIIRALRLHAEKIVATVHACESSYGGFRTRRTPGQWTRAIVCRSRKRTRGLAGYDRLCKTNDSDKSRR